jgi:hypothetical protein
MRLLTGLPIGILSFGATGVAISLAGPVASALRPMWHKLAG